MANEFIQRIFFGGATSPSIYSVTGAPPFVGITPNTGDLALSDAGYLYIWNGTSWILAAGGPNNNIPGIGSSVGNSIAVWDGTTGDLLKDSLPTIDAGGNLSLNPGAGPTAAQLRFVDLLGTKYVALRGPNTIPGPSFFMTLPQVDGAVNQVWKYDGTGNFVWDTGLFVGSSAGGVLTGTYPAPGLAAGAVGQAQIQAGAVDIGQLNVNVTTNYLPTTGEKDAMAGTAGTPGPTNQYVTQQGGTMTGPVTYNNVTNNIYNGGNTYNNTNTYSPTFTNNVWNIVDQSTSNISVTQLSSGETQYTNPTNANQTAQVSGQGITVIDNSKNTNVNIAGDSFDYVFNAAPVNNTYFSYTLNQPIAVNVSLGTDGSMQFKETVAGNTGELKFSAIGSATAGNGVNIFSLRNLVSAPLRINATSLRFTGDLAPNSLPGTSGYVLTSQGAGASPIWTNVSAYTPSNNPDWQLPTPPYPYNTGTIPSATGQALDILAAQNYNRWLNLRTIRTDSGNSAIVTGDQSISVVLVNAAAGARTETLPAASALTGKYYTVKKIDATANTVTVLPVGGNTIDGQNSYVLSARYAAITLISDGSNWFTLDFQTTPGTAGQLLTSGGAGASPTWTNQSTFTNYTAASNSDWQLPTPPSPSGSATVPTTISTALDRLSAQNYNRWLNLRTTESRSVSSNAIVSDNSVSAILASASAGPVTITLPPVATWRYKWLTVKKTDATANAVNITSFEGAPVTIDGVVTQSIAFQWDAITVVSDGSLWYILDQIDSAPPATTSTVSVSLNGTAQPNAPTFVGGFYVPTGATYATTSRAYLGINAPGTVTATIQNASNVTLATFTYTAVSSGFFDVTMTATATLPTGWYTIVLTAGTVNTTAFIRGLYLTV